MLLNKEAKKEIDDCIREYIRLLKYIYDEITFFSLYNTLGCNLSSISNRYKSCEVDRYISIQVDFLFSDTSKLLVNLG